MVWLVTQESDHREYRCLRERSPRWGSDCQSAASVDYSVSDLHTSCPEKCNYVRNLKSFHTSDFIDSIGKDIIYGF